MVGSEYLWPGRFHERLHISTRQYARLVRERVKSIGLDPTSFGTHSMRRTKVAHIYRKTGIGASRSIFLKRMTAERDKLCFRCGCINGSFSARKY